MAEIWTKNGFVEESTLTKTEGCLENENERTTWQEWRDADGDIVKREAQVRLKRGLDVEVEQAIFGAAR